MEESRGTWASVTPPDMILDPNGVPAIQPNFGPSGMAVDLSRPGAAYVGADHQGIWLTLDAGKTWTRIYVAGASPGFDGAPWSMAWAPSGAFAVANNGYGTTGGIYRTTDRGRTWRLVVGGDMNDVSMSPTDENHLLACPHGAPGDWYESLNGGVDWINLGALPMGIWYYGEFLSDSIWIGLGPSGLWRGVKAAGSWTWARVLDVDGPHGGAQFFRDASRGYFYVGAATPGLTRKLYRTSLVNGGADWEDLGSFGGGYGLATVFGTPTHIYAMAHVATTGTYDHGTQVSTDGVTFAPVAMPAWVTNGAHSAAVVMNEAGQWVALTAHTNAGLGRVVI